MVTRMERYNNSLEDVKITKRSDKNKDLYEKVKVTEMNPEYIDINTTNVYEIGSINDVTKRRSSYQKLKSLDDVLEKEKNSTFNFKRNIRFFINHSTMFFSIDGLSI